MKKHLIFAVLAAFVLAINPFVTHAAGINPVLNVSSQGGNNVLITVSNAPAYSGITMYQRQGTALWTTITNYGQTDSNGYFTQVVSLGSTSSSPFEQYVTVGGYTSNTVQTVPGSGST